MISLQILPQNRSSVHRSSSRNATSSREMELSTASAERVVQLLGLLPHPEGGFFKETFRSNALPGKSQGLTDEEGELIPTPAREPPQRNVLTSIYYMLTKDAPIGYWHMNKSTIMHYYQGGAALTYLLIRPNGQLERHMLGPDLSAGYTMQLIVEGGTWKATLLEAGEWGLLGEAVAPGFDYRDMRFGDAKELKEMFPDLWDEIKAYLKDKEK